MIYTPLSKWSTNYNLAKMGLKFGNLMKMSGITFFRLSPYEQKAFAGAIDGAGRMIKRGLSNFLMIAPFFMGGYLIRAWADAENYNLHRKDPRDYENDT
ncbi:Cytochrome b-c1 complex subunit 8 [Anthophora plagiata]